MTLTATNCTTSGNTLNIGGSVAGGTIQVGMLVTYPALFAPSAVSLLAAGSGYTNGTYTAVATTYGASGPGTGLTVTVVVSGGVVTSVVIASVATAANYCFGDCLTVSNTNLGGTGSGFLFTISGGGAPKGFGSPLAPCKVTAIITPNVSYTLSAALGLSSNTTLTFELLEVVPGSNELLPQFTAPTTLATPPKNTAIVLEPPPPLPQTLIGTTAITSYST